MRMSMHESDKFEDRIKDDNYKQLVDIVGRHLASKIDKDPEFELADAIRGIWYSTYESLSEKEKQSIDFDKSLEEAIRIATNNLRAAISFDEFKKSSANTAIGILIPMDILEPIYHLAMAAYHKAKNFFNK